ncbi:ArsR/SmtB family transcription factor [Crossiella cryophila]|uniref:HTH arsR-type domain-containing protein n=1 Tax=Crossiella cryophila TaxID=43355 RepID=A0A7W7CKC5_9PSEU|nr:DUF5937 family protein [Crossiella cryophila]MBB4681363.1 hypothetical protein [Crossiella cryophila]
MPELALEFSVDDLARTRFAFSPLWETVVSVRVLKTPGEHALHFPWLRETRDRLAATGLDVSPLADLIPGPHSGFPDFLTPPPDTAVPDFDAELALMATASPEQIRKDLDFFEYPPTATFAHRLHADPDRLSELVTVLRAYWELAIEPYWPRLRDLLEAEVHFRAKRLTQGGHQLLFEDLHPHVRWAGGILRVDRRCCVLTRKLTGDGLLMVPSVFTWPDALTMVEGNWQPTLFYPPRGIATLWDHREGKCPPEALAGVLGRSRATLLLALGDPLSTTDLARRTGLTAGGVSQHLGALSAAGLVTGHRLGRQVKYTRTRVGELLVSAPR